MRSKSKKGGEKVYGSADFLKILPRFQIEIKILTDLSRFQAQILAFASYICCSSVVSLVQF